MLHRLSLRTLGINSEVNVKADQISRQLSDQLVPHVHDKPDSESVNNVQNTSEFQLLKRMEQEYGRPFHQTLQDHIHNKDQLKGHLFYDEDALLHDY